MLASFLLRTLHGTPGGLALLALAAPAFAQTLPKRGALVPFTTYEAEAATNTTTGTVVKMKTLPTGTTSTPELEASGRGYVELDKTGEYLKIPVQTANTLVLRHCIPDSTTGGGITATLSLYVNSTFRQKLTLSSRHNWLYGKPRFNGNSNDPTAGTAHVFWDESRFAITGGVKARDILHLQKDAGDTAAFYRLDCVDLEMAPGPLPPPAEGTYLSIASYGANGTDVADDTAAIQSCITAAKEQAKIVWMPAGRYYQTASFKLDGMTVRGAGMWHTSLISTVEGTTFAGNVGFVLAGSGSKVSDLFIESAAHTARTTGGKPFAGAATNWTVENVWITHTIVGFWAGAEGSTVRGCRIRSTYADGINLHRGAKNNIVEHNHIRGTGDDGLAVFSEKVAAVCTNNILRFNTVIAPWWGHNCAIWGGDQTIVSDNYLADNAGSGNFAVNLSGEHPVHPVTDSNIIRNTFVRGGGCDFNQKRGAVWLFPNIAAITNLRIAENDILDPIFRGIDVVGAGSQAVTFERNMIDHPGEAGIYIGAQANGSGAFNSNTVRKLNSRFSAFENSGGADYTATLTRNSWR